MGRCNCGHLVQAVTELSPREIHHMALQKPGDWERQALDYCPESGYEIDFVIGTLLDLGLTKQDLVHLERLSDPQIIKQLPLGERDLNFRKKQDVLLYLKTWIDMLEEQFTAEINIPVPDVELGRILV